MIEHCGIFVEYQRYLLGHSGIEEEMFGMGTSRRILRQNLHLGHWDMEDTVRSTTNNSNA